MAYFSYMKTVPRRAKRFKNVMYQRITGSRPHVPPTCSSSLRFTTVDGFHRRDFRKLEGLSIDNDNAGGGGGVTRPYLGIGEPLGV